MYEDENAVGMITESLQNEEGLSGEEAKMLAEFMVDCGNAAISGYRRGFLEVVVPVIAVACAFGTYGVHRAVEDFKQWKQKRNDKPYE